MEENAKKRTDTALTCLECQEFLIGCGTLEGGLFEPDGVRAVSLFLSQHLSHSLVYTIEDRCAFDEHKALIGMIDENGTARLVDVETVADEVIKGKSLHKFNLPKDGLPMASQLKKAMQVQSAKIEHLEYTIKDLEEEVEDYQRRIDSALMALGYESVE